MFSNTKLFGVLSFITTIDNSVSMHIIIKILEEILEKLNLNNVVYGILKIKLPQLTKENALICQIVNVATAGKNMISILKDIKQNFAKTKIVKRWIVIIIMIKMINKKTYTLMINSTPTKKTNGYLVCLQNNLKIVKPDSLYMDYKI